MQAFISNWDGNNKTLISKSLSVNNFEWSPDGKNIALTVVESPMQSTGIPTRKRSLAIYNRASDTLEIIAEGNQNPQHFFEDVISFSIPFWAPSGDKLGFLRTDYSDRWASVGEMGIYDLKNSDT